VKHLQALWLAALLTSGCVSEPAVPDAPGASMKHAHAGMPMAFSARVSGERLPRSQPTVQLMDFALRPGETLIRALAGGRWIYAPDLSAGAIDFSAGVRERHGITQTSKGLTGEGWCVIPFVAPSAFAARTNGWITLCASGQVALAIDDAAGHWRSLPVQANGAEEKIDISSMLESRNDFDLRLTLGVMAQVSQFRFASDLQSASPDVPELIEGINVMTLKCKDKYGLATVIRTRAPDFGRNATVPLARQAAIRHGSVRPATGMQQAIAPDGTDPVQAVFSFEAPAGETFAWFSVFACLTPGAHRASLPHAQLAWRSGADEFGTLSETTVSNLSSPEAYRMDGEQLLDKPGQVVEICVTSDTPITGLKFVGHLNMSAALALRPKIIHRWQENGVARQFIAPVATDRYFFRCGVNPCGHCIELTVPSFRGLLPTP